VIEEQGRESGTPGDEPMAGINVFDILTNRESMGASQVRTKKRVSDHGEVLTGHREVIAMLDLVKQETERIDSRFLEPACGDGNFLTAILERKLAVVEKRYGKSQLDFERYAILAVSSIYGIDILPDNVRDCRRKLFEVFEANYKRLFKHAGKPFWRGGGRALYLST
jgi:hypothetical protein